MSQRPSIFLARDTYRRRRLRDVARVLPIVGAVLLMVPLTWSGGSGASVQLNSNAALYVFGAWLALIVAAACLSGPLSRPEPDEGGEGRD
ncbi:hypothetical protein AAD018_005760 [Aestuariibius insulae]|uniref:hypothetical protein n=1 Tax=Aestuariibius insulae TaxID=2058287 RepID=UPI00398F33B7